MVAILEAEHGAAIGFATGDVDALLDVRAVTGITLEGASRLLDAGFEPDRSAATSAAYAPACQTYPTSRLGTRA